jgi:hypothetical protein
MAKLSSANLSRQYASGNASRCFNYLRAFARLLRAALRAALLPLRAARLYQ